MISIIIPTYNRVEMLKKTIQSCLDQSIKEDYEIIIVDDGSSDGTVAYLTQMTREKEGKIRFFSQANQGPAAARNLGIDNARGSLIAFTDDDCIPEKDWLKELVSFLSNNKEYAGVGGVIEGIDNNILGRYVDMIGMLKHARSKGQILYLVTANAMYTKASLDQVGRFKTGFKYAGGEDYDLSCRLRVLGYKLASFHQAKVFHLHKKDLASFCRTRFAYGMGLAQLIKFKSRSPYTYLPLKIIYHAICDSWKIITSFKYSIFDRLIFIFIYPVYIGAYYMGYYKEINTKT